MFFQSLQDISLNEVSVHWMGHTELTFEAPYEKLKYSFLQETSQFYEQ